MIDQKYVDKVNQVNKLPINETAYELMAAQREPILTYWIHAVQATQLAVDNNLVMINNPQLQKALYQIGDKDPDKVVKILDLENLNPDQDLAGIARQVLDNLDMYLTETVQGYPNLQE